MSRDLVIAISADVALPGELRQHLQTSWDLRNLEESHYRDIHGTEESSTEVCDVPHGSL